MGSKTLVLLHFAPAPVVVSERVVPGVLTVDAYTDVPSKAPPATTTKTPIAAIKLGVSLRLAATTVLPDPRTLRQRLFACVTAWKSKNQTATQPFLCDHTAAPCVDTSSRLGNSERNRHVGRSGAQTWPLRDLP